MKPSKTESLLQGQTSIARKMFEFVPVAEEWTELQIAGEMRRVTGSAPDLKVTRGCLRDLADSGLIRRRNDKFRRAHAPENPKQKETKMPAAKAVTTLQMKPTVKHEQQTALSPIEILGDIAGSIVALRRARRCNGPAGQGERGMIEQGQEANAANLQKLKQLQSLLRSLGE